MTKSNRKKFDRLIRIFSLSRFRLKWPRESLFERHREILPHLCRRLDITFGECITLVGRELDGEPCASVTFWTGSKQITPEIVDGSVVRPDNVYELVISDHQGWLIYKSEDELVGQFDFADVRMIARTLPPVVDTGLPLRPAWIREGGAVGRNPPKIHKEYPVNPDDPTAIDPSGIADAERSRREEWSGLDPKTGIPCDVFGWVWGEPPKPYLTKVGGKPFMPAKAKWPMDTNRKPMCFVYQICFLDSKDLFPSPLPGDVLLFFCQTYNQHLDYQEDPKSYCFRWVSLQDCDAAYENPPKTSIEYWPLHGAVHRSFDEPEGEWTAREPNPYPAGEPVWRATKIGGVPHWEQGNDLGMTPDDSIFLAQIRTDNVGTSNAMPYLGCDGPLGDPWELRARSMTFGDCGSAYLFLQGDQVCFRSQS